MAPATPVICEAASERPGFDLCQVNASRQTLVTWCHKLEQKHLGLFWDPSVCRRKEQLRRRRDKTRRLRLEPRAVGIAHNLSPKYAVSNTPWQTWLTVETCMFWSLLLQTHPIQLTFQGGGVTGVETSEPVDLPPRTPKRSSKQFSGQNLTLIFFP